jgi:ADP-ribosylglycohydrolase
VRVHVGLTHKDDEVLAAADAFVRILVDAIPRPEASPRTAAEAAAALRESILQHGRDWISAAKLRSWEGLSDRQLVGGTLSSACYIEEAFPAALALAWRHAGNLAEGVCANAMCGGDNCHRGVVVGGLLGATAPIPAPFLAGLACGARVTAS